MEDMIQNFANYPIFTFLFIGILLIIGGITKGDIDLKFVKIPSIKKKRARYLIVFGFLLMLIALVIAIIKFYPKNHSPIANDDKLNCKIGETRIIDVLKNDSDEDSMDPKYLQIIGTADNVSSLGDKIEYMANEIGYDTINYQLSDGKGGIDTAKVTIKVDPKYVNIKGKLGDIFGKKMSGKYNIIIDDEICSIPIETISVSDDGIFELSKVQENQGCKIIIDHKNVEFNWDSSNKTYSVTYDPIDSIHLILCKGYEKSIKEPQDIINNTQRFDIQFEELEKVEVEYNGKIIEYGRLYFQPIFFGSNKKEYSNKEILRRINCKITQKNEDKINYKPFKVTAGTSLQGWRSDFNKKLLRGEYELLFISETEKQLKYFEFQIK